MHLALLRLTRTLNRHAEGLRHGGLPLRHQRHDPLDAVLDPVGRRLVLRAVAAHERSEQRQQQQVAVVLDELRRRQLPQARDHRVLLGSRHGLEGAALLVVELRLEAEVRVEHVQRVLLKGETAVRRRRRGVLVALAVDAEKKDGDEVGESLLVADVGVLQREDEQQTHDHVLDDRALEKQDMAERARAVLPDHRLDLAQVSVLRGVALGPRLRLTLPPHRNGCDFPRVRVAHLLVGLSLRAEMLAPLRDGALWGENAQRQLPRDAARAREREVELRVTGTWAGTLWT